MGLDQKSRPSLQEVGLARELAERHLAEAKAIADRLRVRNAQAILEEEFPDHTLAVFTRAWDEDKPKLLQLISGKPDVDDIEYDGDTRPAGMTHEQSVAWWAAEKIILRIGSDDELSEVLDAPSEIHEDWVEFDLPINDARDLDGTESARTSEQKETT